MIVIELFGNLNKLRETALNHRGFRQQKGDFRTALMEELIKYLETVINLRQVKKVKHKMSDIIAIVVFLAI